MKEEEFDDEEFDDEEFDDEFADKLSLVKYSELAFICSQHENNGGEQYTQEEFEKIVQWIEDTRMNESLIKLVLDGKLDVDFDLEKLANIPNGVENALLFNLIVDCEDCIPEMENLPPISGLIPRINFEDENE